jgi:hypothetical protein
MSDTRNKPDASTFILRSGPDGRHHRKANTLAIDLSTFREPSQTDKHVDFSGAQRDRVERDTSTLTAS